MVSLAVPAFAAVDPTVTVAGVHSGDDGSITVTGEYSCENSGPVALDVKYTGLADQTNGQTRISGLECATGTATWSAEVPVADPVLAGRSGVVDVTMTGPEEEVLTSTSARRAIDWPDARVSWESYILKADATGAVAGVEVALNCEIGEEFWVRAAVWQAAGPKGATRTRLLPCRSSIDRLVVTVPGEGEFTAGADVRVTTRLENADGTVLNERSVRTRFGY